MRIVCVSLEDFVTNLKETPEEKLIEGIVRVSVSENQGENEVRFDINFQASCVVEFLRSDGNYLMEVGIDCGRDIRDAEPDLEGTKNCNKCRESIAKVCDSKGWKILPGHISI